MPFLRATLASVARQTVRNHRIIAWDNGSVDDSVAEMRRWIPERIPGVVVADSPLPLGDCTRAMVEMAQTELIAHTDGDDVSLPDRLETQLKFCQEHPEVGFVGSLVEHIDENDQIIEYYQPRALDDASLRWDVRWECPFVHSSVMFRRSAAIAAGNFRVTPGIAWDDQDMWLRASLVSEFRNLKTPVAQLRHHPGQTTAAVRDYTEIKRIFAMANRSILFPGVPAERAMDLWDAALVEDMSGPAGHIWHLSALRRAAIELARRVGKPDDYFTSTQLFRARLFWLRRRVFRGLLGLSAKRSWYDALRGVNRTRSNSPDETSKLHN